MDREDELIALNSVRSLIANDIAYAEVAVVGNDDGQGDYVRILCADTIKESGIICGNSFWVMILETNFWCVGTWYRFYFTHSSSANIARLCRDICSASPGRMFSQLPTEMCREFGLVEDDEVAAKYGFIE